MFKYDVTSTDLHPYYERLDSAQVIVNELILAIKIGASIGTSIAVLVVFINISWILYDFKQKVLNARKGIFDFDKSKAALPPKAGLSGAIISNSVFMFFLTVLQMSIIFTLISWPLFWKCLWNFKWVILATLSGSIINFVVKKAMNKL